MSKKISSAFIETLSDRVDVVSVINARVPLKRAGANMQACCPFHHEKTPSFSVSPQKQFYYCFGCGAKGDAIKFLMEYEHLSFVEAVEKLAEENGMEVIYEHFDAAKAQKRKDLYDVLEDACHLYEGNLYLDIASETRNYLKQRGLDREIAKTFRLGYSNNGNYLQRIFAQKHSDEELTKAGLLAEGERGRYDQFRNRLMFPIRDPRGRVLGFGARALGEAKPKYLNSSETEVFLKRYTLYGLYETLQTSPNIEHLIVVEGYMDVIALYQQGIFGAVASLGTALTAEHIELARKYTKKIYICFDGDNAGRKAATRAMQTILASISLEDEIRVVFLPEGEDPDTLVRRIGKGAFLQTLQKGLLFSEFVYNTLVAKSDLSFVEGRGEVASRAKQLFDSLSDSQYKSILYEGFVKKIGMDVYNLPKPEALREVAVNNLPRPKKQVSSQYGYRKTVESPLLRILIEYPEFAIYAAHLGLLETNSDSDGQLLKKLLEIYQNNKRLDIQMVLALLPPDEQLRLKEIEEKEGLIDKVSVSESFEARRLRFKNKFVLDYEGLVNRLQQKKRLR